MKPEEKKLLETLRASARRASQEGTPEPAGSVFEFAARSRLNTSTLDAAALRARLSRATPFYRRPVPLIGSLAAVAALACFAILLIPRGSGTVYHNATNAAMRVEVPEAKANIILSPGAALVFRKNGELAEFELKSGNSHWDFSPANSLRRIIQIGGTGHAVEITGTRLVISLQEKIPLSYRIFMGEGKALLKMQNAEHELKAGNSYLVEAEKFSARVTTYTDAAEIRTFFAGIKIPPDYDVAPRTLEDIRLRYQSLTQLHLYNGKTVYGAILSRGEIYSVFTLQGILKISKDDIRKETPL